MVSELLGRSQNVDVTTVKDSVPELSSKSNEECANILNEFYNRFSASGLDPSKVNLLDCPIAQPEVLT